MAAQWYWQSDLRSDKDDGDLWTAYAAGDNKAIETAYGLKRKTLKIMGGKYTIDFKTMIQHVTEDDYHRRFIKRVVPDDDDDDGAPPAKKAKKEGKADVVKKTFDGFVFARAGTFSNNAKISTIISNHGGETSSTVTKTATHLIVSVDDDTDRGFETLDKTIKAKKLGIKIVKLVWDFPKDEKKADKDLQDAVKKGKVMKP